MKRALIIQSGGPTAVINQSLYGIVVNAQMKGIDECLGSRNAFEGIAHTTSLRHGLRSGYLVDLYKVQHLDAVAQTPGSALGSSRKKIGVDINQHELLESIIRTGVSHIFTIGGNDSADNAKSLSELATDIGYNLSVYHVPKTIDNDLRVNDHTPGYGSAARYVATAIRGDYFDTASLPGVKINIIMGRHAGFLTAASALARNDQCSAPHAIYLPERPFNPDQFVHDIDTTMRRYGQASVAVSEGIENSQQQPIGWDGKTTDSHGNPVIDGLTLAMNLRDMVKDAGLTRRIRCDVLGNFQRSFLDARSSTDADDAYKVGHAAVGYALESDKGSVALVRTSPDRPCEIVRVELDDVARHTKRMPDEFIDGHADVTRAFINYATPLIGAPLPPVMRI